MSAAQHEALMGSLCYSLSSPHHEGYKRHLLEEVSCELLHVKDSQDAEEGGQEARSEGLLAAVSFRREQ